MKPQTIRLSRAYRAMPKFGGEEAKGGPVEVTTLELREPTVADLIASRRVAGAVDTATEAELVAICAGVPVELVHSLALVDWMACEAAMALFTLGPESDEAGGTSGAPPST